jgi:hypothetical protein
MSIVASASRRPRATLSFFTLLLADPEPSMVERIRLEVLLPIRRHLATATQ